MYVCTSASDHLSLRKYSSFFCHNETWLIINDCCVSKQWFSNSIFLFCFFNRFIYIYFNCQTKLSNYICSTMYFTESSSLLPVIMTNINFIEALNISKSWILSAVKLLIAWYFSLFYLNQLNSFIFNGGPPFYLSLEFYFLISRRLNSSTILFSSRDISLNNLTVGCPLLAFIIILLFMKVNNLLLLQTNF